MDYVFNSAMEKLPRKKIRDLQLEHLKKTVHSRETSKTRIGYTNAPRTWPDSLDYGGQISVSFTAQSAYVPPYEGEQEEEGTCGNYNFRGSFKITGGNEYYTGIRGAGNIAGTFQAHDYDGDETVEQAVEFVMMGKAFVR